MEKMKLKDAVVYAVQETSHDWAVSKMKERDARYERCKARIKEMETAGLFNKIKLNAAEFLEDFGPLVVPCVVIFGGIAHGLYRVFFT